MKDLNQRQNSRQNLKQLILISVNLLVFWCALQIVTGVQLQIETNLLKAICIQTKEFSKSQKVQLGLQNKQKYEKVLNNANDACREVSCTKESSNKIALNGGKCQNVQKINCGSSSSKSRESRRQKQPTGIGANHDGDTGDDFSGYKVYSVTPKDTSELQSLVQMGKNGVQFWQEPTVKGVQCDFMLSPEQQTHYLARMRTGSMQMKEIIADVQAHIRQVNVTDALCEGGITWDAFYNLKDIYAFIDKLADVYPDHAKVITYGQSYEQRPLKLISISESFTASGSAAVQKPIVFIECNIHAREWISAALCTFLINDLLIDKKECISTFLKDFDFYLIPVANPDGYFFSHNTTIDIKNRLWRKTRSVTSDPNCLGADPNRNFDTHWMESGTSSDPCTDIYGGLKPNSEVEVESLQNYLLTPEISNRLRVYLPVHSAAQSILWPWSSELKNISDEHYQFFWETSENAIKAMEKRYGTKFYHGPSAQVFGPISGSADDWTYEKILQHKKTENVYVATIELRMTPGVFVIPGSEIIPHTLEAMDGICVIVQAVGGGGPGPVKPPMGKTTSTTKQPVTNPPTGTQDPDCN